MIEIENLKPCPFCGSAKTEFRVIDVRDREGVPVTIVCVQCGASGPWKYVPKEDVNLEVFHAWNTRV